jgi:hypothetical protein
MPLKRIDVDWQLVTRLVATTNGAIDLGPLANANCFTDSCKHHLQTAQTGQPLPRTLPHPQ